MGLTPELNRIIANSVSSESKVATFYSSLETNTRSSFLLVVHAVQLLSSEFLIGKFLPAQLERKSRDVSLSALSEDRSSRHEEHEDRHCHSY